MSKHRSVEMNATLIEFKKAWTYSESVNRNA